VPGRASGIKMVEMAEMGAPVSLDGVAFHPWDVIAWVFSYLLQWKMHEGQVIVDLDIESISELRCGMMY